MNREALMQHHLQKALERREQGAVEYGDLSFLDNDNLTELKEELYDIINYALFTLVQVDHLKRKMAKIKQGK